MRDPVDRKTKDMFEAPSFKPDDRASGTDTLQLDMVMHDETFPGDMTRGAILVSIEGHERRAVWIPKRLCEFEGDGTVSGFKADDQLAELQSVRLKMRRWLARDSGLI